MNGSTDHRREGMDTLKKTINLTSTVWHSGITVKLREYVRLISCFSASAILTSPESLRSTYNFEVEQIRDPKQLKTEKPMPVTSELTCCRWTSV